jgi:hypothetical protein
MGRGAVLAGLVAFFLIAGAQTFDQPRPRGAEIAREQALRPVGCPRETLVRFSVLEAWIRELPLGGILAGVAARELIGSCGD